MAAKSYSHKPSAVQQTGAAAGSLTIRRSRWQELSKHKVAYLFICPFFILYAVFGLYPALYALVLSFQDWAGRGNWIFVGVQNYVRLLTKDPVFAQTGVAMAKYLVAIVPIMTLSALAFAVLLNSRQARRLGGLYHATLIMPYVLAPTVISVIFYQLYDPNYGWLNLPLIHFGLKPISWLNSEEWSLWAIAIVVLWQFIGYNTLIALAGLTGISPEIYDAAKVDGCTWFQEFFHVTLPLMRPILLFMAIMSTIGVFNMYAQPWLLTHGGPGYASNTFTIMLYRTAFEFGRFGYAAAIGVAIFVVTAFFSFLQIRLNRSEE